MTTRRRRRVTTAVVLAVVAVLVISSFSVGVAAVSDSVTIHESVGGDEISVASDGQTVFINASDGTNTGGNVTAEVDGGNISVTLYDDGTGDDDNASDGVYWGNFTLTSGATDDAANEISVADGNSVSASADIDANNDGETASITADYTAPTLDSAETVGADGSGNVDEINVTFSEAIDDSRTSLVTGNFSLSEGTVDDVTTGDAADDDTVLLTVSGLTGTNATPVVTVEAGAVADEAGNDLASQSTVTPSDGTAPIQDRRVYDDADGDGMVDTIRIEYSEDISASSGSLDASEWSVAAGGDPNLSAPTNIQLSGVDVVFLNVSADANVTGPQTTSISNPRVRYAGTSIVDESGNEAKTVTRGYTDVADPVFESAQYLDTDDDGTVDRINVTFTELISSETSSADASDLTLSGDDNGSVTKGSLTIPGTGPTIQLGVTGPTATTSLDLAVGYTGTSLRRNSRNTVRDFSSETVDDGAAPVVSSFSLTEDAANDELDVSFDATESLSSVSVSISGPESDTLTSFSLSGSTYTASAAVSTNGDYTATLDTANDAAGNGASTTPSDTATVSFVSTPTPTPTPAPTAEPQTGGSGGSPSELSGTGSKTRLAGSTGLSEVGVVFGSSAAGTVSATELSSLSGTMPPGIFVSAAEITVSDRFTDTPSTVQFAISRERLDELGVDAASLTVHRYHDGRWNALETRVVNRGSRTIVIEADTPGFSRFAVMAGGSTDSTETPTATAVEGDDVAESDESTSDAESDTTDTTDTTAAPTGDDQSNDGTATSTQTPGFGVGVTLVALLSTLALALAGRRRD